MKTKIICIVGMAGSGKSVVSDELVKKGFLFLRFGQITLDKIKEMNIELDESNEKKIREEFRKKYGMGAFATLNIPKLDDLLKNSNVVVDGLYSWSEYKILKEKYGESLQVVGIYAPPNVRYSRLSNRSAENDIDQRFRPFAKDESKARDYAEIENIEKGGPIVMADFTIINIGTKEELRREIDKILSVLASSR